MQKFKVAGYVRLSKEQYDNKESNSITNQKQIINRYIYEHDDLELVDFYIDDGHTGTDFNRPGFKLLLEDLKNKKVNTIVVKDLSRFGRNYIEVGNYIENIFTMMNVRFISINDDIDTKYNSECSEYIIPIKNIFNDHYSKDISMKVRSVLKNKKMNGEFVGKSAPYGYLKDPQDKHKFIIDKEASKVIIKIFDMALNGKTRREISDELNNKNILPPALYKIKNNISNYKETDTMYKWNPEIVNRILRNVVYTGDLIQNKSTILSYRIHKVVDVLEDDWIVTKNHHKAIISKEVFESVQNILDRKKGYFSNKDILAGYLKCADCGKSMILRKSKDKEYYYCSSFVRNHSCTNHSIRKDRLEELILKNIKEKYPNIQLNKINDKVLNDFIDIVVVYDKNDVRITYKNI